MLKLKMACITLIFLTIAFCIWIAVRPAKIVRVDNGAVFVKNLPVTTEGKLNWWMKNKELLQKKYNIFDTQDNYTVTIMNFGGYEKLPKGTRDGSADDYTCFDNGNAGHKKCVYNSIAMVVRGSLNGKGFININGEIYLQSGSEKAILYKSG